MILRIVLLGVITCTTVTTAQDCVKIFAPGNTLPDDELMNAFYIVDPDPKTGYVTYTEDPQTRFMGKTKSFIKSSSLTFDSWLQTRHDGKKDFQNLWVYVSRLIASDVDELYAHFQSLSSQTNTKPRAAIDFEKLRNNLSDVCGSYEKSKLTWPYSCVTSKLICALSKAMEKLKPILQFSTAKEINGLTCQLPNFRPLYVVNKMSRLAVENDQRAEALKLMFETDIVKDFPEDVLLKPLYQSGLVRNSVYLLLSDQIQSDMKEKMNAQLQALKSRMEAGCTKHSASALGSAYYCKAKDILAKTKECYTSTKGSPCIYRSIFQHYFQSGRFIFQSELRALESMKSRTSESIKSISNAIVNKDQAALKTQVDSYKAFIDVNDVNDEKCRYDWPKAFDCGSSEECKIRTVYRSDCILYFLNTAVSRFLTVKGSKDWSHTEVVKAKALLSIYLFYQPYLRDSTMTQSDIDTTITTLHQEIDKLRNKFNIPGFEEVVKIVPPNSFLPTWMKRDACFQQTIPKLYKPYCVVSSLVDALHQFTISIQNSLNKKIRNLNPSIDYKSLLEQLSLSRISAFLGQQAQMYFQILSNKIDEIPDYLQQNFGAVGTYFEKLAIYDSKKSAADISFIHGSLNKFKNALAPKLEKVSKKFGLLLGLAIGASVADLIQRGVELGLEIAINCNPLKAIFGGSDPGSIMDRVSALMKSTVTLTKLITLGARVIPELGRRADILKSGFEANAAFIDVVKTLIEKLNSKDEDLEGKVQVFLTKYNDYSPEILRSQITGFGAYWEAAIDEMCEAAFEGGSAAAAAVQIGITGKGDCLSIRPLIAEVITLNEEIYDFQFEMMETLATACRAKYASKLAKNMQIAYTSQVKVDMNFFRNNAIISYLISTLHIWGIVTEYCDILTYTGSGILPTACTTAKELPDSTNVGRVLSHKQDASCNAGSRATVILKIPTATTDKGSAYINTDRLFKGESISFKIPDSNWLLSKKLIPSSELNNEAFYVEQFQMFIPANPDGAPVVQILVSPTNVNVLRVGVNGLKYVYLSSGYVSRYKVNQAVCFGTNTWLPYDYCHSMSKICIIKDGKQIRDIQPSIFNTWRIRMTDPTGLTPPDPKTNIELMAKLTYCTRSNAAKRKRRTLAFENLRHGKNRRQASSKFCCPANKYWAGTSCQECPAGSKRQLSGYYCQ